MLLADGSEPGPVYFDVGSGSYVPSSREWHVYDGRFGRPRAAVLRGSCSCGSRGMAEYPLDWTELLKDKRLDDADADLSGPIADYDAHLSVIRDAAHELAACDVPIEEVAVALGTSEAAARIYLGSFLGPAPDRKEPTCGHP
ncbi:hypothetical protein ACFWIB_04910 [Streptomyces sp. NPDC127051]|uniref:hypothetical protein n=1 Tax=Streptomyces sp. NPDC127051 TaxID=3347119 RepID=UPI003650A69D